MIHVPIIVGLRIATVIYRNRQSIAQVARHWLETPGTNHAGPNTDAGEPSSESERSRAETNGSR
jgi:hypothetical protein